MTDVVYIVGPGERDWLRWSLRSLRHLEHDRVWLVGTKPSWCTGVLHVPVRQNDTRFKNSTANVRAACEIASLSDEFVLMNDDFYFIRDVDSVPVLNRGSVESFMTLAKGEYADGFWRTVTTFRQLGYDVKNSHELHVPMLVDKELMHKAITLGQHIDVLHKRTAYAAVAGLDGDMVDDPKVKGAQRVDERLPFISTDRGAIQRGRRGYRFLTSLFPQRCMYEGA